MDRLSRSLLGFLRARPRPVGEDFRGNQRHESNARACIAWSQGASDRTAPARLIDISRLGAALSTAHPPPQGLVIRLRLVGNEPTPWIEAQVLAVEALGQGRHRVRLQFREPCAT